MEEPQDVNETNEYSFGNYDVTLDSAGSIVNSVLDNISLSLGVDIGYGNDEDFDFSE